MTLAPVVKHCKSGEVSLTASNTKTAIYTAVNELNSTQEQAVLPSV